MSQGSTLCVDTNACSLTQEHTAKGDYATDELSKHGHQWKGSGFGYIFIVRVSGIIWSPCVGKYHSSLIPPSHSLIMRKKNFWSLYYTHLTQVSLCHVLAPLLGAMTGGSSAAVWSAHHALCNIIMSRQFSGSWEIPTSEPPIGSVKVTKTVDIWRRTLLLCSEKDRRLKNGASCDQIFKESKSALSFFN